jgi:hypothetical protein
MLSRLLLDPAPEQGGGGAVTITNPTATPAATPTPTPAAPPAATPPAMVPLTVEEYQRLRGMERELAEARAEQARKIEAAEQARSKAIADKDGAEAGLKAEAARWQSKLDESTTRYSDLERQYLGEKKSVAIADGLDGKKFRSEVAAKQVRQLLEPRFVAERDAAGRPIVRDAVTGRPAADVIKEAFAAGEFDHFLDPTSGGGAGAAGTHRSGAVGAGTGTDRIALQLKESAARQSGGAPGLAGNYAG